MPNCRISGEFQFHLSLKRPFFDEDGVGKAPLALPTQPHFRPQINWRSLKRLKVEVCPFHPPNPPSPTLFACSGFALRKQEGFQTIEPSDSPSTSDGQIPYELCNQNGKKFLVEFNISLEWSKERESTAWVKISLLLNQFSSIHL